MSDVHVINLGDESDMSKVYEMFKEELDKLLGDLGFDLNANTHGSIGWICQYESFEVALQGIFEASGVRYALPEKVEDYVVVYGDEAANIFMRQVTLDYIRNGVMATGMMHLKSIADLPYILEKVAETLTEIQTTGFLHYNVPAPSNLDEYTKLEKVSALKGDKN